MPVATGPGVWCFTDSLPATAAAEFACRLEDLGYTALWLPETVGREPFTHAAHLLGATRTLTLATGIASIYHATPARPDRRQPRSRSRAAAGSYSAWASATPAPSSGCAVSTTAGRSNA